MDEMDLTRLIAASAEASRTHAEAAVRQAIASETFSNEVRQWRETLQTHTHQCEVCLADVRRTISLLENILEQRQERRSWWQSVWGPIIVALIGALSAILTMIASHLLGRK